MGSFPSDHHAVVSQIEINGFTAENSLLEIGPRDGEDCIRMDDLEKVLKEQGSSIALVMIGGLQYYTGQAFDIPAITKIAHAVGNLDLHLHEWNCDFAVWCTYKYLNCGPG